MKCGNNIYFIEFAKLRADNAMGSFRILDFYLHLKTKLIRQLLS